MVNAGDKMASLNDYNWHDLRRRSKPRLRFWGFWLQLALSLVLVVAVAALIGNQGRAGDAARYLVGQGLAQESSWFSYGRLEGAEQPTDDPKPPVVTAQTNGQLRFLAPASGVVVKDIVLDAAGFSTDRGIVIQGLAGQAAKATAAGEVSYLGESESGFIVELQHSEGFTSVYQGLSELSVAAGATVAAGEALGLTETGELIFSLYQDGEEVDPLSYLFQQEV